MTLSIADRKIIGDRHPRQKLSLPIKLLSRMSRMSPMLRIILENSRALFRAALVAVAAAETGRRPGRDRYRCPLPGCSGAGLVAAGSDYRLLRRCG
jgi:hypothetical protein